MTCLFADWTEVTDYAENMFSRAVADTSDGGRELARCIIGNANMYVCFIFLGTNDAVNPQCVKTVIE
jgi:hypothetical protein